MSSSGASYYDDEAGVYDETRGGQPRAQAAAEAVASLVPSGGVAVDVAGGTGIVSAELARMGWSVLVSDLSVGMLQVAAERLPGRVLACSADRLALRDASVDLVTTIWLLHLLPVPVADRVVVEAARVLRPGGHLVTTVDKDLAHGRARRTNADHGERVTDVARRHGLAFLGGTSFAASTQWRSADGGQVFAVSAYRKEG
ncbi:MAG TPA: class I SAM-dependent methyltransferase [Nocardioidaceae bacterium]|nr:class I SAM-dependent methyltransferase [Nocardioidaceae bacterium]